MCRNAPPPRVGRVFRTFAQVVYVSDRTRVFARARLRLVFLVAALVYGLVLAIGTSADYVEYESPDGWWPLLFAIVFGSYAILPFSTITAWRLATVSLLVFRVLLRTEPDVVGSWQWWFYLPVLLVVAATHTTRVVLLVGLLTSGTIVLAGQFSVSSSVVPTISLLMVLYLLAFALGSRGRAERRFHAERDEKAALVERARIAREMHDVVAHHMSLVVVRCETAPYRITGLPEPAVREFAELGESARSAITDMQRLLGVLRAAGHLADTAPQPGLAQIREIVPDADVPDADVPEAVALTAYRVVQEATTNARRHAPGSTVTVRVSLVGDALEVVVRNTAGGPSTGGGSGHGLIGMRERVGVHGGTVTAEPLPDGGFEVLARVPVG